MSEVVFDGVSFYADDTVRGGDWCLIKEDYSVRKIAQAQPQGQDEELVDGFLFDGEWYYREDTRKIIPSTIVSEVLSHLITSQQDHVDVMIGLGFFSNDGIDYQTFRLEDIHPYEVEERKPSFVTIHSIVNNDFKPQTSTFSDLGLGVHIDYLQGEIERLSKRVADLESYKDYRHPTPVVMPVAPSEHTRITC